MEILRSLRIKANYTYQEMANLLGVSKTYYWQIENNKRTLSYQMAVAIAAVFHKTPDNLFYEEFKNKA